MTMETTKEIKDYLHLYLGCECILPEGSTALYGTNKGVICAIRHYPNLETAFFKIGDYTNLTSFGIHEVKPILRNLSDMTEEEFMEVCGFGKYNDFIKKIDEMTFGFEETRYLLSKHFDLFGLIEAGLAIDASKLKKMEV